MRYEKSMIILLLAIFILAVATASASDVDDASLASGDTIQMGLSVNDEMSADNLQASEENDELALAGGDENLSSQADADVLSADDEATYYDLSNEISQSGAVNLAHKNYVYTGGDTIVINENNKVIDGGGAVIDMAGSTIRAFNVAASGVTIKNLAITGN